jgi:hypothetical protein
MAHGAVVHAVHRLGPSFRSSAHFVACVGISSIGAGLSAHVVTGMRVAWLGGWLIAHIVTGMGVSLGLCRGRLGQIMTLMLRQRWRGAQQHDNRESGFHCPLSGPITVTVCIIPPCM